MRRFVSFRSLIHRALFAVALLALVACSIDALSIWLAVVSLKNTQYPYESLFGAYSSITPAVLAAGTGSHSSMADDRPMPDLNGGVAWLNSSPLNSRSLRGKVVLVNFWTYTCINSLRALPYVKAWEAKYQKSGLVVIGVHTPEFSFEKEQANVEMALRNLHVNYPVVMDSNYRIWQDFNNQYWPAFYIVDAKGTIRYTRFGEGDYGESEHVIKELLRDNGAANVDSTLVNDSAHDIESPPSSDERSPETYLGYRQSERFSSPGRMNHDRQKIYVGPADLSLNHWALVGSWNVGAESAVLQETPGKITFRFHSRDLHLVMAPSKDGKPIRFKVLLDGAPPGVDCGVDSAPDGTGELREPRLYQLIRQKGSVRDRTFEIQFLDPGAEALDFTFG